MEMPEVLDTPEFKAKWMEWESYRRKRRLPKYVTNRVLINLAKHGHMAATMAIDHSITNNYQGLFPEKFSNVRGKDGVRPGGRASAPAGKYASLDAAGSPPVEGADDGAGRTGTS